MMKVYFNGQTKNGSFIYDAMVTVPEDYTMNQLVKAIRNAGYISFMTATMKRLVKI